uniref:Bee-milk protein n=1 Tax=Clastoptera arizonana TaxID=38151 RepID=A0A1B6CJ61_9HEMI
MFTSATNLSPSKILVFDLNSNTQIRELIIRQNLTPGQSIYFEKTVDINNDACAKAFAYLADPIGFGLLVYDWEANYLRRLSNAYMFFDPQSRMVDNLQVKDGIMGLALSPIGSDGFRSLYFHVLASYNKYNVSTQVLQNPRLSLDFTRFKLMGNRGEKSQYSIQRLDEKSGVLFYTEVQKKGIGCWNSKLNPNVYSTATNGMVVVDRTRLTFPSALIIDKKRNVWVISNSLFLFFTNSLNPNKYNYRVLFAPADILIKDTICDGNN